MKITKYLSRLAEKRTRNVLAIIVMFACTSICFGEPSLTLGSNATHRKNVAGNSDKDDGTANDANIFPQNPNKCTLIVNQGAIVGEASGACIDDNSAVESMTGNKIIVNGGNFNKNKLGAPVLSQKEMLLKLMAIQLKLMQEGTYAWFMVDGQEMEQLLIIQYL
ncbi:hypothetical protein AGMMS49531_04760 [Endomicrobiia bacterium]|nr:hypothetical protein AGMMS49531_04760 [Endomicrobiia bacterium]